ncbi:T9SS sorting signal type C domain-containing protein [Flavobacterium chungnamense]
MNSIFSFVMLLSFVSFGQTNPTTATLPFNFTGAATLPTSMAVHRFGTSAGAIPTTRITTDGNADLPVTTTNNSGGYMIEGVSGVDGVTVLASGSQSAGAIISEISTTGLSNISVSWISWTKLDQASYTNSIALQYRVGDTGTWTNVDSPSSSVYSTSTAGRASGVSYTQTLPAGANNQTIVQVRWIYWVSAGASGSRDRLGIDEVSITGTSAPTINGTIVTGEYGVHTNGSNQQGNTYLTWDDTNLYVAVASSNTTEAFVLYLDKDPQIPVNGGTNANGTSVGQGYDGTNFAELQYRADLVLYVKNGYREYRTADGSNGWTGPTSGFGSYAETGGNTREFSIPWSTIGGQPSAFNFFSYVTSSGGFVYGQTPTENAGGTIGTSARYSRYYTVSSTTSGSSTLPFSRNSYVFNSASDVSSFGPITAYDFTMNTSGRFLSRTGNTAGNWVINGNLVVGNGTIYLGSGGGSYGTTSVAGNLNLLGGSFNMDQTTAAMSVTGNVSIASGASLVLSGTSGGDFSLAGNWSNSGTFSTNTRLVTFNGTTAQTLTGATTFDFLTLNNTTGLTLNNSAVVNQTLGLTSGKITLGANDLTVGNSGTITGAGATNYVVTNGAGQLKRTVAASNTLFAVGNASYNPITLNNSGTSDVYGVIAVDGTFATPNDNTRIVNRRWQVTEAVAAGSNLAIQAQYNTGEPAANFAAASTPYLGYYNGSVWSQVGATLSGANPFVATSSANSTPSDLTTGTNYFAIGKDAAFIALPATQFVITSIAPVTPQVGSGFNVTVEAQNALNVSANVTANTSFTLTTNGNAGAISGTITGTIVAGTNSIVVSGVILATTGTGATITATQTSGDPLTAGTSAAFNVVAGADHLTFVGVPATGYISTNLASFTVEARRPDNSVDTGYTANVTIAKASGPGNLGGTVTVAAVAGIATFNAAQFDAVGSYTLTTTSGVLTPDTSGTIVVTLAPVSIFANPITGSSPGNTSPYTTGQTFDTNITVSGVIRGSGISGVTGNDRYTNTNWTLSTSIDANDYIELSLTPNLGYSINFEDFNFTNQRSGSGPSNFSVRSSLDGFSTDLGVYSNTATNISNNETLSLSGVAFNDISSTITFRIYGYNATNTGGTGSLNDFNFRGNVTCVEPVAYSVTGGGNGCATTGVAVGLANSQVGVSYQLKIGGTNTGSPVAGTGSAISFGNQLVAGTYTVEASNTNGTCNLTLAMTGSVVVTLDPASVAGTVSANQTICENTQPTDISLIGNTGTIQWQSSPDNITFTDISGETAATLAGATIGNLTATSYYRAMVTSGACTAATSAVVIITVTPSVAASVSIAAVPSGVICSGTSVTFTATPTNGGATPSYQWKINGTDVSGQTASTFTSSTLANGNVVTVVMTSNATCVTGSPATSAGITMQVSNPVGYANLQFPPSGTICQGGTYTVYGQVFQAGVTPGAGAGSGITVEFGYDAANTNPATWTNWFTSGYGSDVGNNDEYVYNFTPSLNGVYYYTFRYKSGACDWQYGGYNSTGGGFWNGTTNVNGVLTVNTNAAHTISLTSGLGTNVQSFCQNTALPTAITYAVGGGATGAGVTGLPAGMSGTYNAGVFTISGIPSAGGVFNYIVTTTGNGCATAVNQTGTLTISSTIDYANLQFPGSQTVCEGASFTAYGQVFEPGVTPGTGVQGAGIIVEFGYDAANTNPATWTNWFAASFNSSGGGTNNDEYQYVFTAPTNGTFYYTFRYKQGTCDWQYGGYNAGGGGFWNGTTNNNGVLTVNPLATASISSNNGPICSGVDAIFTLTGTSGAVVTYNLNGGTNTTVTLTGGTAIVTVTGATANQTLNLVSVTNGVCPASLTGSSTVTVNLNTTIGSVTTSICSGQSYIWPANGQVYTTAQSGTIFETGCNTATLNLTINTPPTISCPANVSVNTAFGECSAIVNFAAATVTGSPAPIVIYSQNSGTSFPVGTTTVTATATNSCGSTSCTFTVTVNDIQNPTVSCTFNGAQVNVYNNLAPGGGTAANDKNFANISRWAQQFTASRSGSVSNIKLNLYRSNASTGGSTTFDVQLWSGSGAIPTALLASLKTVNWSDFPINSAATNTSNFVNINNFSSNYDLIAGTTYWLVINQSANGPANKKWSIVGSGRQTASFNFNTNTWTNQGTVSNLGAEVTVSDPIRNTQALACNYTTVGAEFDPSGSIDNCGVTATNYTLAGATTGTGSNTLAGVVFNKGLTTVTWTVTDSVGNTGSCSFTVTIIDNAVPTLTSPNNQSIDVISGTCAANYTIADPINDNCSGATWGYTLSGASTGTVIGISDGISSGILSFNKGVTTVTLSGTDGTNTATTTSFTVTVTQPAAPTGLACWETANLNTTTCLWEVTGTPPAAPTFTQVSAICSGASMAALPTTSDEGITGTWSPPVNNLATTTYTFTPTIGQCASTATMTITVIPNIPASVSIVTGTTTICSGASVTFTATPTNGGTTPTYQWSVNGETVLGETASTFTSTTLANNDVVTVEMTSNATPCLTGSPATSTGITMTVNPLPTASISGNNGPVVCSGSDITFSLTGTSGAVVTYNINGGSNTTATLTGGTATVTVTGATATQTLNLVSLTDGTCPVSLSGSSTVVIESTTWDGTSWSNGTPTSTKAVSFTGNYTIGADFDACSISVSNNAVVSVTSGYNVTLNGAITVASGSSFTLNNNANLYQVNALAVNTGNIIVKRQSNPLIRLDYTMWSSPVTGQGLYSFSPFTFDNRFYVYNTSSNLYNNSSIGFTITGLNGAGVNGTDTSNVPFTTGKGYLIRLPYNHPTAPVVWNGSFTGVPNNGTKTITLANVSATQQFNAVGNPYPSPISIAQFASDNTNAIEPTLYFWRKTNNASSPSYCTWNTSSATFGDNGEAYTTSPNGVIQTGQGFFVEAKDGATSLEFNNGQRVSDNTNQFFRANTAATQTNEAHRVWLNLTGTGGAYSQAVVGYFTNATSGADAYDSKYFNDGPVALNMVIGSTEYVIQGRPTPFQATDIVPLNYKVTTAGTYTFAIDHVDGLFTGGAQAIYIKDNQDGSYHNLSAPYTFTSAAGTFANRFELVYQTALAVDNNDFTANSINVIKQQNDVVVRTAGTTMQEVTIYDIRGRVLVTKNNINASETKINVGTTNQVLLVQVTTTEGIKATKKVVN